MRRRILILGMAGILTIVVIVVAVYAIRYYTASPRGKVAAREQIQSAGSRIANYNHFFNLCAAVQAQEAQLDALYTELAATTAGTKDHSRVLASITGVSAQRQRSIFQYNADARKDYTAGQFRDSDLPYQLDPEEAKTSCGSA